MSFPNTQIERSINRKENSVIGRVQSVIMVTDCEMELSGKGDSGRFVCDRRVVRLLLPAGVRPGVPCALLVPDRRRRWPQPFHPLIQPAAGQPSKHSSCSCSPLHTFRRAVFASSAMHAAVLVASTPSLCTIPASLVSPSIA